VRERVEVFEEDVELARVDRLAEDLPEVDLELLPVEVLPLLEEEREVLV
jgi:hypothetical protein